MAHTPPSSELTEALDHNREPLDLEQAIDTRTTGRILGLSEITLQQHRAHGKGVRWFRIGRSVRYRLGDVLAFRDAKMVGKAS